MIIETDELKEVLNHLDQETFFIFDLDNTLIETFDYLGSEEWYYYSLDRLINSGIAPHEAEDLIMKRWIQVQKKKNVQLLESSSPEWIQKLQQNNYVIALTKRTLELAERTREQLSHLGIDFFTNVPIKEPLPLQNAKSLHTNGIIYVDTVHDKGITLREYLQFLPLMPKKILFIDDKLKNIEDVQRAVDPLGISYVGIRYSKADYKKLAYDPTIADLQWESFSNALLQEN